MSGKVKSSALASKIKKIMQADEDVGKIAQLTPMVIAHAMELFLERLAKGASEVALARADKVLQPAHLKEFVKNEPSMDFLKAIVEKAPELQEKKDTDRVKRKYVRKEKAEGENGPAKRKGKGKEGAEEGKPPAKRKKAAAVKEEAGNEADVPETKAEPAGAGASPPGQESAFQGQAQGGWQATGQRSSAPGASAASSPHENEQGAAPSLMGVLKDAAVTAPSFQPPEVEEDDYDAE